MVGPRIFHVHETRNYANFNDPSSVLESMNRWLESSDFKVRRKSNTFSRGSKHGIHVNFVPKFRLFVERTGDGYYVKFDYYAKMKIGTLAVVGVLTLGVSTVVGVGTYTIRLLEADDFVRKFWAFVETLTRSQYVVVKQERWLRDNQGNYGLQPLPAAGFAAPPPAHMSNTHNTYSHSMTYGQQPQHDAFRTQPPQQATSARSLDTQKIAPSQPPPVSHPPPPSQQQSVRQLPPPAAPANQYTAPSVPLAPSNLAPGSVYGHTQSYPVGNLNVFNPPPNLPPSSTTTSQSSNYTSHNSHNGYNSTGYNSTSDYNKYNHNYNNQYPPQQQPQNPYNTQPTQSPYNHPPQYNYSPYHNQQQYAPPPQQYPPFQPQHFQQAGGGVSGGGYAPPPTSSAHPAAPKQQAAAPGLYPRLN